MGQSPSSLALRQWGCLTLSSSAVKEDEYTDRGNTASGQTYQARKAASWSGTAKSASNSRLLEPAPSPASEQGKSFQALCRAYERGKFDPANPTGRNAEQSVNTMPVPRTPSPKPPSLLGASLSHPADSAASNGSLTNSKESDGVCSTSSSRLRSEGSTVGRPQPVHELQEMILSPPDSQSRPPFLCQSWNQKSSDKIKAGNKPPTSRQESSKKQSLNSQEGKASWLKPKSEKSVGQSVMPQKQLRNDSIELEGMDDPLEGNPNYHSLQQLNPGSSGSVYHCIDRRTNDEVAIKMVSRGVSNAKAAEREIASLRLCALHPYIIHMREVFLTRTHLAIVFEYASGGHLASYIETFQSSKSGRGLSEERTRWIFQQIVVAIDFCHKMGIANRDIKLENVLLMPASNDPTKPPIVKLCDFGFSKDENADSLCKTACGTPECVAPEVLSGQLYDGKSSDIWSMGVLLFAMLTGTFPFSRPSDDLLDNTASLRKLFSRIATAQYPRPSHISKAAQDLLSQMLQPAPEQRIDIAGILAHPWFGASLQSVALNVNKGLLEMPDHMLTGFAQQSEEEIAILIHQAAKRSPLSIQSDELVV